MKQLKWKQRLNLTKSNQTTKLKAKEGAPINLPKYTCLLLFNCTFWHFYWLPIKPKKEKGQRGKKLADFYWRQISDEITEMPENMCCKVQNPPKFSKQMFQNCAMHEIEYS